MTINSRQKGADLERELAGLVHDWAGVRLIRNQEQTGSGGHDLIVHPDEVGPVADSFRRLIIECKTYQTATDAQIQKWWAQAAIQAEQAGLIPILAYRTDPAPWRVVVPISLFNPALTLATGIEYTAALSVEGFCHAIAEMSKPGCIFCSGALRLDLLDVDLDLSVLAIDLGWD